MNRAKQEIWKTSSRPTASSVPVRIQKTSPDSNLSALSKGIQESQPGHGGNGRGSRRQGFEADQNGQTYTIRRGTKYVIPIIDKKVNLTITAGPERDTSFEVEEGSDFRIPGDAKQIYTLKTVDNATQTVTIANKTTGEQTTLSKKNRAGFKLF